MKQGRWQSWHTKWLGTGVGDRTLHFIRGFQWSLAAALLSRFIYGLTTVAAARWMGPAEFGSANLSLASTNWIQISLFIGLPTALMHFLPKVPPEEKKRWASDGLFLLGLCLILTMSVGVVCRDFFSEKLGISNHQFNLALTWSAGFWIFIVARTVMNGLEKFKVRSVFEILGALLFCSSFALFAFNKRSGDSYILAFAVSYALTGFVGLILIRKEIISLELNVDRLKKLLTYGVIGLNGTLGFALLEATGRLTANRTLSATDLGILSAYQGGVGLLSTIIIGCWSQVFFPIASRTPDRSVLFGKLNRVVWWTLPVFFLLSAAALWAYFFILGKDYSADFWEIMVFSMSAAMSVSNGLLIWFLASSGLKGYVVQCAISIFSGCINVIGCFLLVPHYGIVGVGIAYVSAMMSSISIQYLPAVKSIGTR